MRVITRDLPEDYFTANKFREGDQTRLKYLLAVDRHENEIFVIWGPGLEAQLHREKFDFFGFEKVISAGYIGKDDDLGGWNCWGESMSLSTKARKTEDTAILREWVEAGCKSKSDNRSETA